ncbi:MAG: 30S ribosome-binding factor RbfA [Gammaproteobacteria bacterium]|nr:30S ribosome-binding factor RbfA [Gammaproteobacteria bacterium]MCW8839474.1 30S ribosome-binding factor RbfA [Gammaproteobacteria bacterium]MCW8927685.1 30S ribosome-binding factor RbfA [Gammaproteobacteria bacterium]MCW8959693.1 30S ribosome-binding factor RbfA [Gammaproteobacteria bacterium]MCW8973522.1 30S ribosome-binding factor RbfA [Gammaproteobacteria bacterium]
MAREFSRSRRVGEQIQRELAELVQRELNDPRLGMVTISAVDVSRDLAVAKVYFTVLDSEHDVEQTRKGLTHAAGFLRRELGHRMKLRMVPELRFFYDSSVEHGSRLTALIDQAISKDSGKNED